MIKQLPLFIVLLLAFSFLALFVVQIGTNPTLEIRLSATWQQICGRTFVKQSINITNNSDAAWCITRRVCGSYKLLKIKDNVGNKIAFGMSCGRPPTGYKLQSYIHEFVEVEPGSNLNLHYGGVAAQITALDKPEIILSRSRTYFGSTEVEYVRCADLRQVCPGAGCTWEWLEGVKHTYTFSRVPIVFGGESCPKGFNAWAIDADPSQVQGH